jgi:transposase
MAYYLVSDGGALSHCESWCKAHEPLMANSLTSQKISEILASITIDLKQKFLSKWMNNMLENDYLCYDITSISSYSEFNEYIKYGYNRDNEKLPQLNLAVLFSQKNQLPMYFQRLPGSISDVSTLNNLLKTLKAMKIKNLSYVMDKGFYSKKNIDALFASKDKFLVSVPLHNKWLQNVIDEVYDSINSPKGYQMLDDEAFYINTRLYPWGDKHHKCYLHLYYNHYARAQAIDKFNRQLLNYKREIEANQHNSNHQWAYDAFFFIKNSSKGIKAIFNDEVINQYIKRYTGFQALLSNSIKNPLLAIQIYRDKDIIEKCFDDLKNQLDMKRLRMHSSASADGRLFIQFIALIYFSFLRKSIRDLDLAKDYTIRELIRETETIVKIKYSAKYGNLFTEITKSQQKILTALKIPIPINT